MDHCQKRHHAKGNGHSLYVHTMFHLRSLVIYAIKKEKLKIAHFCMFLCTQYNTQYLYISFEYKQKKYMLDRVYPGSEYDSILLDVCNFH